MKPKQAFIKAGYAVLAMLLALVFYLVWNNRQENPADMPLLSNHGTSAVAILCLVTGAVAGAMAIFFIARAFYIGLTQPKSTGKDDHKAEDN